MLQELTRLTATSLAPRSASGYAEGTHRAFVEVGHLNCTIRKQLFHDHSCFRETKNPPSPKHLSWLIELFTVSPFGLLLAC